MCVCGRGIVQGMMARRVRRDLSRYPWRSLVRDYRVAPGKYPDGRGLLGNGSSKSGLPQGRLSGDGSGGGRRGICAYIRVYVYM